MKSAMRLLDRAHAAPTPVRYALTVAWIGLCAVVILGRDSAVAANLVFSAANGLEQLGLDGRTIGVVVFFTWSFMPLSLWLFVSSIETRLRPHSKLAWFSMPFFALAATGHFSPNESSEILEISAARTYSALWMWLSILLVTGMAAYGLFRLVRSPLGSEHPVGKTGPASGKEPS